MKTLTPTERSLRARIAALHLHAQGKTNAGPGSRAFVEKFEHQVDPDAVLPPEERKRRARLLLKAHMTRLALKAVQERRRRIEARALLDAAFEAEEAVARAGGGEDGLADRE